MLEALSWDKPVVGTGVAFEGTGLVPGAHVLRRDDPEGFADAVVEVLKEPERFRRMLERAGEYLAANFSDEAVRRRFEDGLRKAGLVEA